MNSEFLFLDEKNCCNYEFYRLNSSKKDELLQQKKNQLCRIESLFNFQRIDLQKIQLNKAKLEGKVKFTIEWGDGKDLSYNGSLSGLMTSTNGAEIEIEASFEVDENGCKKNQISVSANIEQDIEADKQ